MADNIHDPVTVVHCFHEGILVKYVLLGRIISARDLVVIVQVFKFKIIFKAVLDQIGCLQTVILPFAVALINGRRKVIINDIRRIEHCIRKQRLTEPAVHQRRLFVLQKTVHIVLYLADIIRRQSAHKCLGIIIDLIKRTLGIVHFSEHAIFICVPGAVQTCIIEIRRIEIISVSEGLAGFCVHASCGYPFMVRAQQYPNKSIIIIIIEILQELLDLRSDVRLEVVSRIDIFQSHYFCGYTFLGLPLGKRNISTGKILGCDYQILDHRVWQLEICPTGLFFVWVFPGIRR